MTVLEDELDDSEVCSVRGVLGGLDSSGVEGGELLMGSDDSGGE